MYIYLKKKKKKKKNAFFQRNIPNQISNKEILHIFSFSHFQLHFFKVALKIIIINCNFYY
jgi:hypothetical protein